MSFLQQLKAQAQAVQASQGLAVQQLDALVEATEQAGQTVWSYLQDLAVQLNVIQPPGPVVSLDGKARWPDLRLVDFRFDARKAIRHQREVFEHLALGWRLMPVVPVTERARLSVNFPPDLERAESRLRAGQVAHERLEVRHPDTHKLQAIVFEYEVAARGAVVFTPDHDQARFQVRVAGLGGLEVQTQTVRAQALTTAWLDDLARAIAGQPSTWR